MAFQSQSRLGSQHILLPARGGFMLATLAVALVLNLLPWGSVTGLPDWLALVIVFWAVHEPRRMGIGFAWALGLVMDAANGALLGQHALAYSMLAFAAIALSRRMLWFPLWPQALHVFMMLLGAQVVMLAVRLSAGGTFPGAWYFAGSIASAALWPLVTYALLSPQRRAQSADLNRSI
jgi:rod shape-determining protein MreD